MNHLTRIYVVIFLLLCQFKSFALNNYQLKEKHFRDSLWPYIGYVVDKNHQLTINDILNKNDASFSVVPPDGMQFGYNDFNYWLKFSVSNDSTEDVERFLEFTYSRLGTIVLYVPNEQGVYTPVITGNDIPYFERPITTLYHVLSIQIPAKKTITYYAMINTKSSVYIPVFMSDAYGLTDHINQVQVLVGLFYGIVFSSLLYNIFIFITTRNIAYLYFVLLNIGYIGFGASFNSVNSIYLSAFPWWKTVDIYFYMVASFFFGVNLMQYHFNTKNYPKTDLALNLFKLPAVIYVISMPFMKYATTAELASVIALLGSLLMLVIAISQVKQQKRIAMLFVITWSILLVSLTISTMAALHILPLFEYAIWIVQAGMVSNTILLSFIFSDKINSLNNSLEIENLKKLVAKQELTFYYQNLEQTVHERTEKIKEANDSLSVSLSHLERAQKELLHAEKMAALGGLVAGVAHEINTPVGISVTAASHLNENTRQMLEGFKAGSLKKSMVLDYFKETLDGIRIILKNASKAGALVESFKQVAVDQTSDESRLINLKNYLQKTLPTLTAELYEKGHKLGLEGPDDIETYCKTGALSQILSSLITNAVVHAFTDELAGYVKISFCVYQQKIQITVSDNGCGIPVNNLAKIFDPFFTTRRGQGSVGLGLHIVHNLVTQQLHGKIICTSSDDGTVFTITFPQQLHAEPDNVSPKA